MSKFVGIVLGKVVSGETERAFFRKGALDSHYTIALYSTGLLPLYNDDRIEITGDINGKKIDVFILPGTALANNQVDDQLVADLTQAFMTLRIKEVK
ncbi:putative replication protein [Kosakonia phage Kc263]|uniref:Replication protein n=1 Tax=Kosakonia phage Kc263 TaxID=2863194 RepID=A0AAE7WFB7_9CAUD|nr:putative replication protein [Kosakonia phage Kc263]QYN80051.1 putative replication protein [Kosakonia phage Kc263]